MFGTATPVSRRRRICRDLVAALDRTPMRRRDDVLLAAAWRVRADLPAPPELLLPAADQAMDRLDLELAEQLIAAAGAGPEADLPAR